MIFAANLLALSGFAALIDGCYILGLADILLAICVSMKEI